MENAKRGEDKFTVLFVCTGNSCRSPMAEGILKARLSAGILEWTIVSSAGILGLSGTAPSDGAVEASRENGIDISGHKSRSLNRGLIDEADLILVMEPHHRDFVLGAAPEAEAKTRLLAEFAAESSDGPGKSIGDPIGGSLGVYRDCFREICRHIGRCLPAIEGLAKAKIGRMAGS